METSISLAELNEIANRLEELNERGAAFPALDWLQDAVEFFALGLRIATSPYAVRLRTRQQKKQGNRCLRSVKAGRRRNNKKAAKRLVEIFHNELLLRLENGPTPQKAYQEATAYAFGYLHAESRATDKTAVLSLFKDLLWKDQQY